MTCGLCRQWTVKKLRRYADGSETVTFEAVPGQGHCDMLAIETQPGFGCSGFTAAPDYDHIAVEVIAGAPWEHFRMGPCPECNGRGSGIEGGACGRCTGTGQVRYYDDGYVGEEKTRRHPSERVQAAVVDPGTILAPVEKASVL